MSDVGRREFGRRPHTEQPRRGDPASFQACAALAEINRIRSEGNNYNVFNKNVCTALVNRILEAAHVGSDVLYTVPARSEQYLSEIGSPDVQPAPGGLVSPHQQMWPQPEDGDASPADFSDWYTRWVKPLR
ncbi:conserved hypothetical protein [Bradyrhizobium oligotrophicum S58]|uniref:Uncharacterized protein n=1 Tax=Bradyrhizobium oligotrophicum S58 TaxID=1245469 RepID=M4Z5M1_9BRAD|nr:hypothetical protein [Bradyrhizobium oligotrophicum]BAM88392.1 conserved hypothetical protein [Bradyrhizobium oligotrophicum S58]